MLSFIVEPYVPLSTDVEREVKKFIIWHNIDYSLLNISLCRLYKVVYDTQSETQSSQVQITERIRNVVIFLDY